MFTEDLTPSEDLLKAVRAQLVLRGLSFAAYCREREITRQNAAAALVGKWNGRKAGELVELILSDLELRK